MGNHAQKENKGIHLALLSPIVLAGLGGKQ